MPEMGDFRWLTVAPPGGGETAIVLMADARRARLRRGDAGAQVRKA